MISYSTMIDYNRKIAITVGQNVRKFRNMRGWSVADLEDKTEELGNPIKRSYILNLEHDTRAKRITVADLFTLSYLLSVPPLLLLADPDGTIHVAPNTKAPMLDAMDYMNNIKKYMDMHAEMTYMQKEADAIRHQLDNWKPEQQPQHTADA